MNDNFKTKFGIRTDKNPNGWWSFGISLSHAGDETYVYMSFFKWTISIGVMYE